MKAMLEVFIRLNSMIRWTSVTFAKEFNEMSKQSLNNIIAILLARYAKEQGKVIIEERLPKAAIYRAFQKIYLYFETPDYIRAEVCKIGNIPLDSFEVATKEIIAELTNEDFANFICECLGTYEMRLYKAATAIASLAELKSISRVIDPEDYYDKSKEIQNRLNKYLDIPGVEEFSNPHGVYFQMFLTFSKLRTQPRWSVQPYDKSCIDFGHLYSTAVLGYLSTLEYTNGNEESATQIFKEGLVHDIPEVWTTDIPSPVKRKIPGFRDALKIYENRCLQENVYSKLPEYLSECFRSIMDVDETSLNFQLLKGADYLSADIECYIIYISGCRHPYMHKSAILGFDNDLKEKDYILSKSCKRLHDRIKELTKTFIIEF